MRLTPPLRPDLAACGIAVVDDAPTNRLVIAASLRQAGFDRVLLAEDGASGLDLVRAASPDLLLLDLLMPGLDGFAVAAALRAEPRFADLPILCMTGLEDADERARAFAAGASDLVLKPVHPAELLARSATHLERRLLVRGLRAFQERTGAELATARAMQQALLPGEAALRRIAERHGIAAAARLTPSEELGGDLWGLWPVDADRVGVFVLDVAGHGTIAAINTFRLHTLLAEETPERAAPGAFLAAVNDRLAGLLPRGQFATMLYGVLDTARDRFTYAAAGSPDPLLARPGAPPVALDGSGLPLGIERGIAYPERCVPCGPGTRLLLHSDALPEARLPDGGRLGEAAARAMLEAALRQDTVAAVVEDLAARIATVAGTRLDDDLTLLCLGR